MDFLGFDSLAIPLHEFCRAYLELQRTREQVQAQALKAVRDLKQRVLQKQAQQQVVQAERLAEGLERIRTRILFVREECQAKERKLMLDLTDLIQRFANLQQQQEQIELAGGEWPQDLEDNLIANHLLRNAYFDTFAAASFASKSPTLVQDLQVFELHARIAKQLMDGAWEIDEAVEFCKQHASALKRQGSLFPFHLRLEQFKRLKWDKVEAIQFAREHLREYAREPEMQAALIALLVPGNEKVLVASTKLPVLREEFIQARNATYSLLPVSALEAMLRLGLVVNKTQVCAPNTEETACPCCDKHLGVLAQHLPLVKRSRSTFVCRISGTTRTERISVFPQSGQAYSTAAMQDLANKNTLQVTDPESGETCALSELRRAYLL